MDSSTSPADFERELTVNELLGGIDLAELHRSLSAVVGGALRLALRDGTTVFGERAADPACHDVTIEIEPIAILELPRNAESARQQAALRLLTLLLRAGARYQMASSLHLQAVRSDYEELQRQHAALQDSERRYRELSGQLEQRVAVQVQTIDQHRRQLYQAEKLASVGQLAAGVAHEINTPIGFIFSNLGTAQGYVARVRTFLAQESESAAVFEDRRALWQSLDMDFVLEDFDVLLAESRQGASRVAEIVSALRDFSNIDRTAMEPVDLNETLRAVIRVIGPQVPANTRLTLALNPLPALLCQAGHLGQCFMNLALNALQAMPDGGELKISTEAAGDCMYLRFQDSGTGITPEQMSRIFDPFYTTRDVGSGTGLGLTVSRDIVRAHGGDITVESQPGNGSTFTVCLPLGRST